MSNKTYDVLAVDRIADNEMLSLSAGGWHILIIRTKAQYFALNDRCSHAAQKLSCGRLRGTQIMCPKHGARFDIASGKCVSNPYSPVRSFPVDERGGRLYVTLPDHPPDMNEIPIE